MLLLSAASAMPALGVSVKYDSGRFSVANATIVELAQLPDRDVGEAVYETKKELGLSGDYFTLSLESRAGGLYSIHERYPKLIYYDSFEYGGAEILANSGETYFFPFYTGATKFSVYDNAGNQVYTTALSRFQIGGVSDGTAAAPEPQVPPQPGAAGPASTGSLDYRLVAMIGTILLILVIIVGSRKNPIKRR